MPSLNMQLKTAAEAGNVPEMARLVTAGANINNVESDYTPLVWAAARQKPEAVKWLLDNGADPNIKSPTNGWMPLLSAVSEEHAEIARMLVEHGANPNLADNTGKTAITFAREKNRSDLIALLSSSPEEVVYTDRVFDRVVQEVYSFKRKERFTFIRKTEFGDVEAVQRESFSDIAEKSGLRKAFEEHVKRGGKLSEEEVFSDTLPNKAKLRVLRP